MKKILESIELINVDQLKPKKIGLNGGFFCEMDTPPQAFDRNKHLSSYVIQIKVGVEFYADERTFVAAQQAAIKELVRNLYQEQINMANQLQRSIFDHNVEELEIQISKLISSMSVDNVPNNC